MSVKKIILAYAILGAMPLEASREGGGTYPTPKYYCPRTYKKLNCKGNPYWFSEILQYRQPDTNTH